MKTAISIPDGVFESAQRLAKRLGISRSELYVAALQTYLDAHRDDKVMEKLNDVYGREGSRLDPALKTLQGRTLRKEKW